jgi:NAD(P)-dependent dehydrogenase (short-subunit alcohol dehydrogenase family)
MTPKVLRSDAAWLALSGRVCVVTGAASGIGAEIARELSAAGAWVALADRDEAGAMAVASEIERYGARAIGVRCDVTDAVSVAAAADIIADKLGPCRVLVNSAGAVYSDALLQIRLEKWNQLLAVNLSGPLLCAQVFGRQMIGAGGGSMVHVASISGHIPQPYVGAYSVSKAALKMLSRLIAVELGENGVRSNVVSPAMVRTPMSEGIYKNQEVLRRREEIVPARRISGPRDVAEVVLFLVSDRASYVSGQDILVDGGLSQAWLGLIPRPGFEKTDVQ